MKTMNKRYPLKIHSNFDNSNIQSISVLSSLQAIKSKIYILQQLSKSYNFDLSLVDKLKSHLFINGSDSVVNAVIIRLYVENGEDTCDYIIVEMKYSTESFLDKLLKLFSNDAINNSVINNSVINKLLELGFVNKINDEFYSHIE